MQDSIGRKRGDLVLKTKSSTIVNMLLAAILCASIFLVGRTVSEGRLAGLGDYNPWADINNDGTIDIFDAIMLANAFGSSETPQTKATIEYDSGWINIIDKRGQYFNITHNLNITDVTGIIVDITGKETINSEPHHNEYNPQAFNATVTGWNQIYRGTAILDYGQSVIQTSDGGYAIAGYTGSYEPLEIDALLIKTDSEGNQLWNKTYGETFVDFAYSVVQTSPDGGYAVAGYKAEGAWLIKTDADGNHMWNKTYGESGGEFGYSAIQTSDGGYAIAGSTWAYGAGSQDFWLIKSDADGNHMWNKTYGKDALSDEYGRSVIQTSDGGYAIAGYTYDWDWQEGSVWLVKTDSEGNQLWNQTYSSWLGDLDECYSVVQTSDGGYALAADYLLIKTDSEGNQLWNKTYGAYTYSVVQTSPDGGYAVAGYSYYPTGTAWLIKTDSEGNQMWNQKFGGPGGEAFYSVVQTSDGAYVATGYTSSFGAGDLDVWLIKTYGSEEAPATEQLWMAWTASTPDTITLYRGKDDIYWNYVRVRVLKVNETP